MSFTAAIKQKIKSHPTGLYVTELYKKRVYQARLKRYTDREFIEREYRRKNHGLTPELDDPQTFSEKLQWLKLYYRDPKMVICADKLELKRYLAEQGFAQLAIPTIAVYERAEDIDVRALPGQFVIKATHGSGWNLVCRDKDAVEWKWMKKVFRVWLSETLYIFGREWHYKEQAPRIMVEPLLCDKSFAEYKFMCFNGIACAVQVNHAINGKAYVDLYDIDWNLLADAGVGDLPHSGAALPKPPQYDEMLAIAETLAKRFPFVRVDMYLVDNMIYVGEMTFFTGGGFFPITPPMRDREFGEWLTLPEKNYG